MLRSLDSWIAVATAIVAARGGSPRRTATPLIVAALAVCSGVNVSLRPSAVTWQDGGPKLVTTPLMPRKPPTTTATSRTASRARPRQRRRARRPVGRMESSSESGVGMQRAVELDALTGARARLDPAVHGVAQVEQARRTGQLVGLDDPAVLQGHLGAGGDVEPGLDHAVVAERDADAGVGPEQAALTDADPRRAAAGEGAHDGGAGADVGAVADDHPLDDAPLDHRRAERAGVEVAEPLVHDRRPGGEVGAEPDPVGVGDAYAARHHVVGHPGELVHAEDLDRAGLAQAQPRALEPLDLAGAVVGPHHVVEDCEDAVEVDGVGLDQAVREQVQPQIAV